jgi:hypothetical protein
LAELSGIKNPRDRSLPREFLAVRKEIRKTLKIIKGLID